MASEQRGLIHKIISYICMTLTDAFAGDDELEDDEDLEDEDLDEDEDEDEDEEDDWE